ncbi:thioesterase II family protein [Actinoplanes aureus]|uniref:Thioesterase n=1 Tax=Actinoplanes aureus TaxID=2792083 RepID=A0A931CI68_9ACTN|nr:alpha/beta fold hydrolase [Actinoplanes aureus]MBG0567758.1 thioesterase [Actinoplanes aureus]
MRSNRWLLRLRPQPDPLVRLLMFPNAGAGAGVFRAWSELFDPRVDVCVVRPPGRDNRSDEPLCSNLAEYAAGAVNALAELGPAPVALFGHSMGGLSAYAAAVEWRRQHGTAPVWLGVAARRAPQFRRRPDALLELPDFELALVLNGRYGGIPAEVAADAELLAHYARILRSDIAAMDGYTHRPGAPLDCPVEVFGGRRDPDATEPELAGWQEVTTRPLRTHLFDGGHFFLHEHRAAVAAAICRAVTGPAAARSS